MNDDDQLALDLVNLKLRGDAWASYAKVLSDLCACYRLQKRPSERLLDAVAASKLFLRTIGENL